MKENRIIVAGVSIISVATLAITVSLFNVGGINSSTVSVATIDALSSISAKYSDVRINAIARQSGSGTRSAFNDTFGLNKKAVDNVVDLTAEDLVVESDTNAVISNVVADVNAVAYISVGELENSVKAVKIDGIEPTAENIASGAYKAFRPFNIITPIAQSDVSIDFEKFVLSKEGQNIVSNKYVSAVDSAEIYNGGGMSGSLVIGGSSSISHVMEELIAAYQVVNPEVEIILEVNDSAAGVQGVLDGNYDIGMASRELFESEKEVINRSVIAYDGIAIIVNKSNLIDSLSSNEVYGIYTGELRTWELGEVVVK